MSAFEYTALDSRGREQRGVLEGDTARHVRSLLRERELIPLQVTEVVQRQRRSGSGSAAEPRTSSRPWFRRGVSAADLALFTRQLATLARSGLPLEEALGAVAEQTVKPRLQSIVIGVRAKVMEGHALIDGLAEFPDVFDELYRATVAAGEQSGHLEEVLERLADYTEARQKLRARISTAMIYPIVLVLLSVGIVAMMMVYVVPKVVAVFENTGQALPPLTVAVIAISDFLRHRGGWVLLVLAVAFVGLGYALRRPDVRLRWHRLLLRLPVLGKLYQGLNTARFTRTLSILAGSGVPVLESLRIAGQVITNLPMRHAVEDTAARVREGASIARSLATSGLFPPMAVHLIASGEASGKLEELLERAAIHQENEMDRLIGALLGLLEPLLIVVMGLVVFLIVIAILLPVIQLNQLVT